MMTQKKSVIALSTFLLTTALSSFSYEAHAKDPWLNLTGKDHTAKAISDTHTKITTTKQVATASGRNLDILRGERVDVKTPDSRAVFVVTKVGGNNINTVIDGALNSNGNIIIQDKNGVLFGKNSKIDVNGIVATTGKTNIKKLKKKGIVEIKKLGKNGTITIEGKISVKKGGLAAFVAPHVVNNGIITAKAGRVQLAGSNTKTTIDLYGDGLLEIAVNDKKNSALSVTNGKKGVINAQDGVIHMTTGAAVDIVNSVINMNGVANAKSVKQIGGKIVLGGANTGLINIAGKATANGKKGGGEITVTAKDIKLAKSSKLNARATKKGNGGTVTVKASNNATINGKMDARGGKKSGDGGTVNTSATNELTFGNKLKVDASSKAGTGGNWIVDPLVLDVQGAMATSFNNSLNNGTSVNATATNEILVNEELNWTTAASLTLNGGQKIDVNQDIKGRGDVTLNAQEVYLSADIDTTGILSGTASKSFVESTDAQIQDAIDVTAVNGLVDVAAGTYFENLIIGKGISVVGVSRDHTIIDASGGLDGFNISGDLGANNVTIEKLAVKNAQRDGVHVADTANLNNLRLSAMWFENNGQRGSAVFGDSVKGRTQIVNSLFFNNGVASTANGDGDILFYHHSGDISLGNVTVQGNTGGLADYGVQIIGAPTKAESGTIVLNNLNVSGQYRSSLLGIQQYDGLKSLTMQNVKLGGATNAGNNSVSTAGWGGALFLSDLGEKSLDISNTEFRANDSNYIVLGAFNGNTQFTDTDIDATKATFLGKLGSDMSLVENFAVEDKVGHQMDFAPFGLVTWHTGNLYATQKSETGVAGVIQRGVDASDANGNIWVQNGNFSGNIAVNKSVKLYGAQAGVDARRRTGATETVIDLAAGGINVTADDVTIDGFEITNGERVPAIRIDNADDFTITNNKIHDIRRGTNADGIWIKASRNGTVTKNWIYDVSDDGLNARGPSGGLNVTENLVEDAGSTGIEAYRLTEAVNFSNNEVNSARSHGIRIHRANGSTVLNNNITMDNRGEGIAISSVNNVTARGNEINNAQHGVSISGGTGHVIDDNDINNSTSNGVYVRGNALGTVTLTSNTLNNNDTGMRFESGDIDLSDLENPNTIIGGETGLAFDGEIVSLENETLGTTIFEDTSANYVELSDGALFEPGTPTNIDALAVSFDGLIARDSDLGVGIIRDVDRRRIESKIFDFDDDGSLGQVIVGLDINTSEEDVFGLNLFSIRPENINVNVTFRGLPRVTSPSATSLASLSPASGDNGEKSPENLADISPAAGGDDASGNSDQSNNQQQTETEAEEKCWVSADQSVGANASVSFSFDGNINNAVSDNSCANDS